LHKSFDNVPDSTFPTPSSSSCCRALFDDGVKFVLRGNSCEIGMEQLESFSNFQQIKIVTAIKVLSKMVNASEVLWDYSSHIFVKTYI
jgi:hypothetical protein